MYDVAVIGAGPAGSEAAFRLASLGYAVVLMEKGSLQREKACGGAIQTIELEEFGWPPDSVVEARIRGARLFDSKRNCMEVEFDSDTVSVRRSTYDTWLQDRARDAGAVVEEGSDVIDVKLGPTASVSVRDKDEVKCRAVIDASGARGVVRRQVSPSSLPDGYGMAVQRWFPFTDEEIEELLGGRFCTVFDSSIVPMGYAWMFPKRESIAIRLGMTVASMRESGTNLRDALDRFVSDNPITGTTMKGAACTLFQSAVIPMEVQSPLRVENALVIGDAAGLANPIHGGGIYPARLSGKLAAEAMDSFLEKGSEEPLLGYEAAIREHIWERNYRWSSMMREFFAEDEIVSYLFENHSANPSFRRILVDLMMRFDHKSAYEGLSEILAGFFGRGECPSSTP